MANSLTTQIIVNGARNAVVRVVGIIDTSDIAATTIVDPASYVPVPTEFRVDRVQYQVEDGISVRLDWDASTDVYLGTFVDAGDADYRRFGGITNNASTGKTGKIELSTEGWAASGVYAFTLVISMTKMGV